MADVSNARPLAIFTGYLATCAALAAGSIAIIRKGASRRASSSRSHRPGAIALFSVLAAGSLAITWYHMLSFFRWSYQEWTSHQAATTLADGELHLGEWLRDTTLFKQAWASALETSPRAWWCMQIFGFCANWSVMLAAQERKRNIPHLWIFMLLGQLVAISVASNLFFLAVLAHDQVTPAAKTSHKGGKRPASQTEEWASSVGFWYDSIVIVTIGIGLGTTRAFGNPYFMYLLLAPHILAFVPLLLNRLLPGEATTSALDKPSMLTKVASMAAIVSWATYGVVSEGGDWDTIVRTLHEHPALSSVGWDVICCWVSYTAWHIFGET